jgi:hypothetical protein
VYTSVPSQTITNPTLLAWLFQATLIRNPAHHIALADLLRLPELFPFDVASFGREAIITSPLFTILREGMNQEYIALTLSNTYHVK